jgi:proteasome lid subunit RPN8/RPN11
VVQDEFRTWSTPQCPFTIEYSLQALDDIRLIVMDAFFSLPRGGAEIGGVLLGQSDEKRVRITGYLPLDCEHAYGPGFVLSRADERKLRELLDQSGAGPSGSRPVGWYHSHTRSEIFLSEADQEIHRKYFPETRQVALVLKPHTFQPMRCGFFFPEAGGAIHASESYSEFVLDSQPLRQVPSGEVPEVPKMAPPPSRTPQQAGPVINVMPEPVKEVEAFSPVAAEPEPIEEPIEIEIAPPSFAETPAKPQRRWHRMTVVSATFAGLVVGAVVYQTRMAWLPKIMGKPIPAAAASAPGPAPATLGLNTIDVDGQLQVRWDRNAADVRQGTAAVLSIADGDAKRREIQLDTGRLLLGNYTYARQGEQVDVTLTVTEPGGRQVHEISGFIGRLPQQAGQLAADEQIQKLRLEKDAQIAKLQTELYESEKALGAARAQTKKLEIELRSQQRKRLGNQAGEVVK